jgi:hypothetical protein
MLKKIVLASALVIASLVSVNLGARTPTVSVPAPSNAAVDCPLCDPFGGYCPKCPH